MFGLSQEAILLIQAVFKKYPLIEEVRLFGSRAIHSYRPNSDIDLCLFGKFDPALVAQLCEELETLPLPYLFDVVDYQQIQNTRLKNQIDTIGQPFYRSEPL